MIKCKQREGETPSSSNIVTASHAPTGAASVVSTSFGELGGELGVNYGHRRFKDGQVAANHSAVAAAVEERSRRHRYVEGLESGAGKDGSNYEYLDHTADVQLHSWGDNLELALEHLVSSMFNVITDISTIEVNPSQTREIEVQGHDMMSLVFTLLDEFLFLFHAEGLAVQCATLVGKVDRELWTVCAKAEGEMFDLSKHPQGTEVKAITYSNMQVVGSNPGWTTFPASYDGRMDMECEGRVQSANSLGNVSIGLTARGDRTMQVVG
ncbi:unnamed protein product [Choristocarpus tenellus]